MAVAASSVVGVFAEREQARQAMLELRQAGFRNDQLGVIARDAAVRESITAAATEGNAGVGAAGGAVAGAGIGGLWGLGVAAGLLPMVGPVILGGTVAAILVSAATGAAAGGIVGALIGLGVPEDDARYFEAEVQEGRILLTVRADGRQSVAAAIIHRCGGHPERRLAGAAGRGQATY